MPKEITPGKATTRRYSEAEKERAVRAVRQLRKELGTDHGTIKRVADQLGIGIESLRSWVKQAEIDAECVYGPDAPRPWDDVDQLELATLGWVHWFNEQRLHSHCGHRPPAEHEAAFYAAQQTCPTGAGNPNP